MEAVQTTNPPSFESVWALFQDLGKKQEETDRIVKENAKQIGKLSSRMGEVVEHMVAPNLREKFRELGYDFPKANPNSDVSDRKNNIHLVCLSRRRLGYCRVSGFLAVTAGTLNNM